jgi:putative ATP-dependent endonuclease of OLD family
VILENPEKLSCDVLTPRSKSVVHRKSRPVLIIVEGVHDVDFLCRLTNQLHQEDSTFPELAIWEQIGRVIFVPFGGGRVSDWSRRFAALECPEFHLYDREIEPETAIRREVVAIVNRRPRCRALLLKKHSLENYLHSAAMFDAAGGQVQDNNDERMSTLVARSWYLSRHPDRAWDELSARAKRRMATEAKRWLNTVAVDRMTLSMLIERDPDAELISWLRAITVAADNR